MADLVGSDGQPDLAVLCGNRSERALDIYTNVPTSVGGPFSKTSASVRSIELATESGPQDLRVGSFLGSSGLDLAIAYRHNVVQILAYPDFDPTAGERLAPVGPALITGMAEGVLNGSDGDLTLDLVLGGGETAETVQVLVNDGSGFD